MSTRTLLPVAGLIVAVLAVAGWAGSAGRAHGPVRGDDLPLMLSKPPTGSSYRVALAGYRPAGEFGSPVPEARYVSVFFAFDSTLSIDGAVYHDSGEASRSGLPRATCVVFTIGGPSEPCVSHGWVHDNVALLLVADGSTGMAELAKYRREI